MIQKSRPPNRQQKIITRQVNLAIQAPPPTSEYLDWSDQYIRFGREYHPYKIPVRAPGLVLDAQIGRYDCSRVFLDAGSNLYLIYAKKKLRAMNIPLNSLTPWDTGFHGIIPGKPEIPLGKIWLDVVFRMRENFRRQKPEFEVMDFSSQYHAILGRHAYFRFMVPPLEDTRTQQNYHCQRKPSLALTHAIGSSIKYHKPSGCTHNSYKSRVQSIMRYPQMYVGLYLINRSMQLTIRRK
jgi:hypothetical protein